MTSNLSQADTVFVDIKLVALNEFEIISNFFLLQFKLDERHDAWLIAWTIGWISGRSEIFVDCLQFESFNSPISHIGAGKYWVSLIRIFGVFETRIPTRTKSFGQNLAAHY